MPARSQLPEYVDVLVVGAGIAGICGAYYLQRDHPHRTYAVLEARDAIGGTWDQFRYPGVRSDSDLQTFGYSFQPWTGEKALADGGSILEYIRQTASQQQIDEHVWLHRKVVAANWVSDEAQWHVDVLDVSSGEREQIRCNWLYTAAGLFRYDRAHVPDFPGRDRFAGTFVVPQFWPEDLDYRGKRVVVIGSGATAVTLVPAIADDVEHVTMLQRSPGYIIPWPDVDKTANRLRRFFGDRVGHALARRRNVFIYQNFYKFSQRYPELVKRGIRMIQKRLLPADFDFDTHLTPRYNPWDERMCLVPNGDFFKAISTAKAEIVTDRIATFTERGIELESGQHLDADIIVSATGFEMESFGGIDLAVDGAPVTMSDSVAFRGMMLSDIPNYSFVVGYTNASWTLKADLVGLHLSRLLTYLDEQGATACVPRVPEDMETGPLFNFLPGYVRRSLDKYPRQGTGDQWDMPMLYRNDVRRLKLEPVSSHELEVLRATGRTHTDAPEQELVR